MYMASSSDMQNKLGKLTVPGEDIFWNTDSELESAAFRISFVVIPMIML